MRWRRIEPARRPGPTVAELFGRYRPRGALAERWPVGWKYLGWLAVVLPALIVQRWWLTAALLVLSLALLGWSRIRWRELRLPWGIVVFFGIIIGYQAAIGQWLAGLVLAGNLAVALYAARFILMTTPSADLLDALIRLAGPLRWFHLSPQAFGLAVMIVIRSVPYLTGSFGQVRQAGAARGLRGNLARQVTCTVVHAVSYAQATAEALNARGLTSD